MDELSKLRWQCRRGIKELDLILSRYLDERYLFADEAEKAFFARLLQQDDTTLLTETHQLLAQAASNKADSHTNNEYN